MWKSVLIAAALTGGCGVMSPPNELASAARAGRLEQIDALIRRGADINQPSGVNGWTPVVHAIHKGQIGALRRLVDLGASLDGEVGRRALMMAGGYGEGPTVRFLLAHGVTPRADGDGGRQVMIAAVHGAWDIDDRWRGCGPHTDVVRTLLARDSTVSLGRGEEARAARAWARDKGCNEMLRLVGE